MGSATSQICRDCGRHFVARHGGGFMFDLLHCDTCGAARSVSHQALGDIHLGFVKGLPGPYAVARCRMDAEIKATYRGPTLTRAAYRAAAEATLGPCACGGAYRYEAAPRCPGCRSTPDRWDEDPRGAMMFYD
jgi:hypothetical protein